jgi:hypothetical protein
MPIQPTVITSDAKEALRKTVRRLRKLLIERLYEVARGEYRLDIDDIEKAKLPEARHRRRQRLEAWVEEREREVTGEKDRKANKKPKPSKEQRERFLQQAVKEAAHTLLNRLVFLRILEHHGVFSPAVVSGGYKSPAFENEFSHYAGPLADDDSQGYQALLEAVYGELELELPGLFGPVGLTPLFPVPAAALRETVEALNDRALDSAWGDDTTLGWVYQYWNDPEREELDRKIANGGKIEPHEIASKTQMFTERYMVEWLLQNSLGLTWLAMCKKHGWAPDAEPVLARLEARREAFRKKREAGEVPLDALMPIEGALENAWKYYVPQPIPADAIEKAPDSVRDIKLLDPACGSGHFLVIAFDLLTLLYQEEARHRGVTWTDSEIAQSIIENNLHGVDIDPRAIQIAAASLWLKAHLFAPEAKLSRINLVAPTLAIANLPSDDPALVQLRQELKREVNLSEELTQKLVESLAGVSFLGSLLRVDEAIEEALQDQKLSIERGVPGQGDLFDGFPTRPVELTTGQAKATVLERLERFLGQHSSSEDLGLRLDGEQLAAGVRFVRLMKEGRYDIVVGNPPYQGLSKTTKFEYVTKNYPRGKADLYAAFLERGLELVREGGLSALLTMRGWMFLGQFADLRKYILHKADLRALGDVDRGAFEDVPDEVLATVISIARRAAPSEAGSVAVQPTPPDDRSRDSQRTARKRAALLAQVGRYEFDPKGFEVIEGEPIVYWWSKEFLERYAEAPKLGEVAPVKLGLSTSDNLRFLRRPWEVSRGKVSRRGLLRWYEQRDSWKPLISGASGTSWMAPLTLLVKWKWEGLELAEFPAAVIRNPSAYMQGGVAFTPMGAAFSARAHRFASFFDAVGRSVIADDVARLLANLNSTVGRSVMESLNPTVTFTAGDVLRLPIFFTRDAAGILQQIDEACSVEESHRETSVEFKQPGPSPWRYAQDWAQRAVDRPEGAPLPPYEPEYDPPAPEAFVSFAIGVALGRFGANGEGILDKAPDDALPGGILFVTDADQLPDSLKHPAAQRILDAWKEHGPTILKGKKQSLRDWLRKDFFAYHKGLYENRPIYFPLSSEKRSFVAYVSIHRWQDNTLQLLLADHLHPALRQLEGEIEDLNRSRASSDKKTASAAERQYAVTKRLRDELAEFIDVVATCAERGAPPIDAKCPRREVDAPFRMDLDDGVMINSAALWPLLAPQWKDPAKWWKQLCLAEGKKDYDWAHLTRRYFPTRVEEKCKADPSLGVAHGCFWKYHPAKAYAWELRLQDEIGPDFKINEPDSDACRERFLREHPAEAAAIREKEEQRRKRKAAKEEAEESSDESVEDALESDDAESDELEGTAS